MIGGYSRVGNDYNFALARYNNDASLPVKLVSFSAELLEEEDVQLSWETELEVNSDYFEIQKSLNGANWVKIGEVKANKNAESIAKYSFTDSNPSIGVNLYRLKMVDLDQTFAISSIQEINVTSNLNSELVKTFPNPAQEKLNIRTINCPLKSVTLFDQSGQAVYTSDKQVDSIDLKNFAAGNNVLLLINTSGV